MPLPGIPRVPFGDVVFLIAGAFGIVFLALAESIGAARSFAIRHGYEIDPDQELIALGAANAGRGCSAGLRSTPASASGRPARRRATGPSSRRSSPPALILAPRSSSRRSSPSCRWPCCRRSSSRSVLGLVNLAELRRYLAWKRTDFLLAMTALGGVVFTTALTGMAIAVALSLLAILYQASRPYIAVLGGSRRPAGLRRRRTPRERRAGPGLPPGRPNVPLTFVNADVAKDQIMATRPRAASSRRRRGRPRHRATADLDVATTDMLAALHADLGDGHRAPPRPGPRAPSAIGCAGPG